VAVLATKRFPGRCVARFPTLPTDHKPGARAGGRTTGVSTQLLLPALGSKDHAIIIPGSGDRREEKRGHGGYLVLAEASNSGGGNLVRPGTQALQAPRMARLKPSGSGTPGSRMATWPPATISRVAVR